MSDWIIVVIFIAFSIVSSVAEKKKKAAAHKAAEKRRRAAAGEPEIPEWHELPTHEQAPVVPTPATIAPKRVSPAAAPQAVPQSTSQTTKNGGLTEVEEAMRHIEARNASVRNSRNDQSSQQQGRVNAPAENPLDDFDLRKAVIYSEILRPKFEE